jgi:glycosyltransferase involved in cell wall biosynthesis
LKNNPPNVVQSSHFFTNIYAGLAGEFLKIPSIGAIRSNLASEIDFHGLYGKWQVKLPRFLITNSGAGYRNAVARGIAPEKIAFVRNVVEPDRPNGLEKNENEITFLFVGRLDALKRPERFVRLARFLTEKYPRTNLRFRVAGDGELKTDTEKLARKLNLPPEKVEFLGVCREMDEYYSRADILVSTSAREGTSNVILEAMAHGLPVIATRVGGTPEILDETRGILVGIDDESALVAAAEKLIFDPQLRRKLGSEGQKYVVENHSLDYLRKTLTGIYEKLTKI